jgi:hypothetical protein
MHNVIIVKLHGVKLKMNLLRLLLIPAVLAAAQHQGLVTFHGLPVPGASVTAQHADRKVTTTTDETGAYSLGELSDGAWTIEVSMPGFEKITREVAVSPAAPNAVWELKLLPLPAQVTRAAPAAGNAPTPAQARAAAAAAAMRNQQAAANSGGEAGGGGGGGAGDSLIMSGSLGGNSGSMTQGESFGNSIKNGKVQYNGNLAFTLDNSVWDAQGYSLNGLTTPKPAYAKGHVNLSFGGPLKIPKLLSGKGGMFTLNYQMGRTRNGSTLDVTVPTALERTGDFSQSFVQGPVTVYDPLSKTPFPGDKVPASRIDSAAASLAKYYPLPNGPGSRLNYQTPIVAIGNQDNLNSRINQQLNKNNRLAGSIGYQHSDTSTPNVFGFVDGGQNNGISVSVTYTHTFSKRLINNATLGFSRSRTQLSPYFADRTNVAAELGIQGTSSLPLNWGPPNLSFTNFATLADGNASLARNQTTAVNDGVIVTRAKHQFNIGGDFRRQQINPLADSNGRGSFAFTGLATSLNGVGGYDYADFLLGTPDTASIRFGNADKYFRSWKLDGYITDNWKLNQALTVSLALRYDYTAPYTELYNRMANLDVAPGFGAIAPVQAGQPGEYFGPLPASLIKPDRTAFSPNLGLAWRPFPKRAKTPTIIRLGYGMMHPGDIYSPLANNLAGQPPFAKVLSVANTASNPLTLQNGFSATPAISNTYAIDPNYRLPVIQQWMVFAQQVLPRGMFVFAGAVGVNAAHLDQEFLPNSLPPGVAAPVGGPPSGYIYAQTDGNLRGNLGVLSFGRQMASGFSAGLNYTLADLMGNGGLFGSSSLAQNWQDLNAERTIIPLVPRSQLTVNWQYSTGQGKAGGTLLKGWKGGLVKDWTVTNALSLRSGAPLTATVGGNLATVTGTGITGTVRPNATGLPIAAPSGSGEPFNLAAFTVPSAGTWGNAGRGTIPGPVLFSLNGSISRVFRLSEKRSFDLRFDATNFLNHVTITGWSTVVNAYNYGLATGTNPMRSMTAHLRFRF